MTTGDRGDDQVRCPSCGAAISMWARRCPDCDGDLTGAELVPVDPSPEPPTVAVSPVERRERDPAGTRRRLGRRRMALIALSVVAVGASTTWAIIDPTGGTPSWPATLKSRSVVEMHNGELVSYSAGHPSGVAYGFSDRPPQVTAGPIEVSGDPVVVADGQADALTRPTISGRRMT